MRHHDNVSRCLGVFLGIAGIVTAVVNAAAGDKSTIPADTPSNYYKYSDDWAIVSAPPPPGPYQSVNVDPRIPGQEDIKTPFYGGLEASPMPEGQKPGDYFTGAPPAAGLPGPAPSGAYSRQNAYGRESPPGYYRSPNSTRNRPAAPGRSSAPSYGYPGAGYPGYGYAPSPWNGPPAPRTEDAVPPPSRYNQKAAPPAPDQLYRRGSDRQ